ncbi:MAG: hypothetical protein IJK77_07615 [Lachnospiraceae bacterium]|nr:hypothetical protein [Lachnospiraceae bacterium]
MKTNRSKWIGLARIAALLLMLILFINSFMLFKNIRRDIMYGSKSTGLYTLNGYFDEGNYQKIFTAAAVNEYADDELSVDVSQYEAFGRWYRAYVRARSLDDNAEYLKQMEKEKSSIYWKKILDVISVLEEELNQ